MPFLTLTPVPIFYEGLKEIQQSQDTVLYGSSVAKHRFVSAMLQHGKYDRYYFLCSSPEMLYESKNRLMVFPDYERAELVLIDDCWQLNHLDQMALFDPGADLNRLADVRRLQGCVERPVTGLIHSISGHTQLLQTILTILGDLYEYDCLVCTSLAGRRAVENLLGSICGYLERKYHGSFFPKFQLPVIPLGVDADRFQPGDKINARRRCKLPEDHVILLYVGRFSTVYKTDLFPLILAFSQILATTGDKKVTLVLVGDDVASNLSPRLRSFGADLGIADNLQVRPNITNAEWALVAPYLSLMTEDAPQRDFPLREVFNGLRWIVRSGSSWRLMPHDLPPWYVVYQQTQRWIKAKVFESLVHDLRAALRIAEGREALCCCRDDG